MEKIKIKISLYLYFCEFDFWHNKKSNHLNISEYFEHHKSQTYACLFISSFVELSGFAPTGHSVKSYITVNILKTLINLKFRHGRCFFGINDPSRWSKFKVNKANFQNYWEQQGFKFLLSTHALLFCQTSVCGSLITVLPK